MSQKQDCRTPLLSDHKRIASFPFHLSLTGRACQTLARATPGLRALARRRIPGVVPFKLRCCYAAENGRDYINVVLAFLHIRRYRIWTGHWALSSACRPARGRGTQRANGLRTRTARRRRNPLRVLTGQLTPAGPRHRPLAVIHTQPIFRLHSSEAAPASLDSDCQTAAGPSARRGAWSCLPAAAAQGRVAAAARPCAWAECLPTSASRVLPVRVLDWWGAGTRRGIAGSSDSGAAIPALWECWMCVGVLELVRGGGRG